MAVLAENNAYLSIDGIDISAYWIDGTVSPEINTNETTHGSGTDWEEHAPGLKKCSASFQVVYDITNIQSYIDHIAPGAAVPIIWGPEGSGTGKPKHDQDFIITAIGPSKLNVKKEMVVFDISAMSTGSPRTDMFANGTF